MAPATAAPATEAPVPVLLPTATLPPTPAATLKIWADDTRTPILQALAPDFLAKYNVELVVEDLGVVQDIRSQVIIAIPAGEGPDIYIGVHDWLGALIESGLVAPIDLGAKAAEFVPSTLDAFTYTDGKLYGVPYATENLGLFYNTDLVQKVPATWDEVLQIGKALKDEGKVDYAIAISKATVVQRIAGLDGLWWLCLRQDCEWRLESHRMSGWIARASSPAVTWMEDAVEDGLIPDTLDTSTADTLFETGKIPFLMTGPWALDRIAHPVCPMLSPTASPRMAPPSPVCRDSSSTPTARMCYWPRRS